jgi:TIGR03009 family protein
MMVSMEANGHTMNVKHFCHFRKFAAAFTGIVLITGCVVFTGSAMAQQPQRPQQPQQRPQQRAQQPAGTAARPQQRAPQRVAQQPAGQPAQAAQSQGAQQRPATGTAPQVVATANAPRILPANTPPPGFQLNAEQQERLNKILSYWEITSSKVNTFTCQFKRWEYNGTFQVKGKPDESTGIIRYARPDKGEFKVVEHKTWRAEPAKGTEPVLTETNPDENEHWLCDGATVYQLIAATKTLRELPLPADMQGNKIFDGPLPFVFGASKEVLLQRYWLREELPPDNAKDQYWLRAVPKFADDQMNYQSVLIVLDRERFLPVALNVYLPENTAENEVRHAYQFFDRSDNDLKQKTQQFLGSFIVPKLPAGWKREVIPAEVEQTATRPQ